MLSSNILWRPQKFEKKSATLFWHYQVISKKFCGLLTISHRLSESIFFVIYIQFFVFTFWKENYTKFIWRQSMYFACLFRLRSMLPLRFQKKMQCFRLEIKSFVVAGKKINDVGVFPSLPYVHKLTLNNAETWYYRGRQKGHIRCDLERKKKYLHIISQRKMEK